MLNPNFTILGGVLIFLGASSYIIDTLKGKVKPNKISWGLWALCSLTAFAAEVKEGVGIQSLMTFMVGFSPLLIFVASFVNKKSYWKITKFDISCAILSILGIALWITTNNGNVAIVFSIFADLTAGVPTLVKSYKHSETESYIEFLSSFIASIITMLTFTKWTFTYYGFPLYIFLYDLVVISFIKFKIGKVIFKK